MKLLKWDDLTAEQKREVRAAFVHWNYGGSATRTVDGKTFEEWASSHAFYFRNDGRLSHRPRYCEPAWLA